MEWDSILEVAYFTSQTERTHQTYICYLSIRSIKNHNLFFTSEGMSQHASDLDPLNPSPNEQALDPCRVHLLSSGTDVSYSGLQVNTIFLFTRLNLHDVINTVN